MIYVWLKELNTMHSYKSHEEYWESLDNQYYLEGYLIFSPMVEDNTPLWRD